MSEIRTRLQGGTPFFPNMLNNGSVEVCLKEDVDKVLAEKDREIALLKERICNGDVSRLTWIDDCLAKDKEIAELKAKLVEKESWVKMLGEGEATLSLELEKTKQKLEDVNELVKESKELLKESQKMHQRCADNASKQIRRLRRALYKACANWAMNARMVEIEAEPWGENHESRLWAGVYDKCLKKAEENK